MMGVHAALLKLAIILFSLWRQGQKAHEDLLIPGLFTLIEELFGMIRVFEVLVSIVTAHMAGNQLVI